MKVNAIIMTPFSLLKLHSYCVHFARILSLNAVVTKEFCLWKSNGLLVWLTALVITQCGAQAPVFDISRQSSTRRPTTAHLLKIWPCCRSFTGTRRPDGGSPSRRSSQIAARVTFDWGNGSRHGDGTVFHAHARVIITQWSFCSSYTIFSCAVIRDVCLCFYRLFIIQEELIGVLSLFN